MPMAANRALFNEINITPLTDIFLVLLIIMMVVAPMMRQMRADITPPEIASGQPASQDRVTVEVAINGDVFLDGEPIANTALTDLLTKRREGMDETADEATADGEGDTRRGVLIVRADQATQTRAVLNVFDAARDAGFAKLIISGSPAGVNATAASETIDGGGLN